MDYKQTCRALKLLPSDKQLLLNKCVLVQKVAHGKISKYLKDLMIPSERLDVHEIKKKKCLGQGLIFLKLASPF